MSENMKLHCPGCEAIHQFFGLSYANYLVLHRTLLQSMPDEWQERFCALLEELGEAFYHVDKPDIFQVQAKDIRGRFVKDPVPHYNRGRTYIEPKAVER